MAIMRANPFVVKKMIVRVANAPGLTAMRTYENGVALETVSDTPAADTPATYPFTAASAVGAGEWFGVSLDQANARTANEGVGVTVEIEETITL